ncbi:YchJ family protein [Aquipuribacter hungaricus]|uniref:UPF0225 protein ACFOLH_14835 n=1 Tax=Aquipuribacter hungaricus TaxID=545624 RepID=A0ABV7WIF8_9MICO
MPPTTCPCSSGLPFDGCCGPVLADVRPAPTAEQLMRSRYTAFVLGDREHLLRTWHASTRPATLVLDDDVRWEGLEVLDRERGGPFDDDGTVEFRAHHRHRFEDGRGEQHERSRFVRERGRWSYVGGTSV